MQRARFLIICAMGALVLISGIMLLSSRLKLGVVSGLKNMLPANVDMRLENLTLSESGDLNRTMSISASSAQYYKAQDIFMLVDIKAKIVSADSEYLIVAPHGRYEQGLRIVSLSGNVTVTDKQGGVLAAPSLVFNFADGFLHSEEDFTFNSPDYDLSGASFVFYV
ncbi:MAG: LPS export ABC transporter periplasmic protein LptC, partial [Candidatus Adiutrix sp.]